MVVLRHRLDQGDLLGADRGDGLDFLMAWVAGPQLTVHPSHQRYAFVRSTASGSVVRYEGSHRAYLRELELDAHGLVRRYPGLATRVGEVQRPG